MSAAIAGSDARPSITREATAAAVLFGLFYSLSPVTVWLAVITGLATYGATRGLGIRERRWVVGTLGVSIGLRAFAIAAIAWRSDPTQASYSTIFGDGLFAIQRSLWIRNAYLGVPVAPRDFFEAFGSQYARSNYHSMLAVVQVLLGPAPYGVHVLSATLYLIGVIALYRTARASFGPTAAFVGLVSVLFLPTLFLWSVLPLKESIYFFLMAVTITSVVGLFRARSILKAIGALALVVAALAAIDALRAGGFVIAIGGLVLGLIATVLFSWRWVLILCLALAPFGAVKAFRTPAVHDALLAGMRASADRHIGNVRTPGTSYKLLYRDYYFGTSLAENLTFEEGVNFVASSVVAFLVVPAPWAPASRSDILMAPQQIAWYVLLLFACRGAVVGLRRDRLVTCLLAANALVGIAVIAPNSGNVGTLIRHRDMIVPFIVWLGAVGMAATLAAGEPARTAGHLSPQ